jgi:hypothetical protein
MISLLFFRLGNFQKLPYFSVLFPFRVERAIPTTLNKYVAAIMLGVNNSSKLFVHFRGVLITELALFNKYHNR